MSTFFNLLKLPENDYEDLYDQARFKLTWRVNVTIFYAVSAFTVVTALLAPSYLLVMAVALIFVLIILITIRKTRKFEFAAKLFLVLAIILSSSQLFLVHDMVHLVDLIWYLTEIIFAYFVLGKKWGSVGLVFFTTSLICYIFFSFDNNLSQLPASTISIKIFQSLNAVIGSLVLGYIIHHFVDTNRFAEVQLQGINKDLNDKQIIIENQNHLNEVMFKEIHHRVKNNLQITSSLLKLQSFETDSEEVKNHFNEAIGRIRSMALIHEKMYSNDDLTKINIASYLSNLSKDICESIKGGNKVKMNIQSELEKVDVKSMVPISLIFNELITNSIKHGIKGMEHAEIDITIKSTPATTEFQYSDNGTWISPAKENSFGLELVETLTSQLDGEISRSIKNGTRFTLTFKTETLFYS